MTSVACRISVEVYISKLVNSCGGTQDCQQLLQEVVWPLDRLATDIAASKNEAARVQNRMKIAGCTRTVADVDSELEALEAERSQLERQKDEILRKQSRLRSVACQIYPVRNS